MSLSANANSMLMQFLQTYFAVGGVPVVSNGVAFASGATNAVSTTALTLADITGITAADVLEAKLMWLTVSTNTIRFWLDGTVPTTSSGHTWSDAKAILTVFGNDNIQAFRLIRNGASDATVQVSLFR